MRWYQIRIEIESCNELRQVGAFVSVFLKWARFAASSNHKGSQRKTCPQFTGTIKEIGLVMDLKMSIVIIPKVIISCESNLYSTHDQIEEVYYRVFDLARAAYAYFTGNGLRVIIERVRLPSGEERHLFEKSHGLSLEYAHILGPCLSKVSQLYYCHYLQASSCERASSPT